MYAINSQTTCTVKVRRALEVPFNMVVKNHLILRNDRRFSVGMTAYKMLLVTGT